MESVGGEQETPLPIKPRRKKKNNGERPKDCDQETDLSSMKAFWANCQETPGEKGHEQKREVPWETKGDIY